MTKPESYKTVMCKGWLEMGGCRFGDNCRFAHGEEELRPIKIPVDNPKYKTKLCDKYTKTGVCPYGNRCLFIHPKTPGCDGLLAQIMKGRKRLLLETKREAKLKETILTGSITIENIFDYVRFSEIVDSSKISCFHTNPFLFLFFLSILYVL
ncbi:unnamed protein product [Enterobius vermicularis]|uniref:Zinc finger protein n=1 Tax=Enterobius vermicularis TaxID=51028 RepID=A0A0N4V124_ENTVE|nr:unnamed protein product [Enterobius vermicularis]